VHRRNYGRICPIETPEGPNIGLIASSPPRPRERVPASSRRPTPGGRGAGHRRGEFYSALEEEKHVIAQGERALRQEGPLRHALVSCRKGRVPPGAPEDISLMDVSPNQLVRWRASLIPFLENDDATAR